MELTAVLKRAWMQPERPARLRLRPASSVGVVMARVKCNLGLLLLANGLSHLCSTHPTRVVGESALDIVSEQLRATPHGSFVRVVPGPRIYLREALTLLGLTAVAATATCWLLYTLGVLPAGVDDLLRLHVVDPLIRHQHEHRQLTTAS